MKSLLKNYIDLLNLDKIKDFALQNNINLSDEELNYVLNLIKTNYEDILINDEKYLEELKFKINPSEYSKIEKLYKYYKTRYKGYLF